MQTTGKICFVDTETTGLPGKARVHIVEIAGIIWDLDSNCEVKRFVKRMRVPIPIESGASAVHGITNAMLQDEPWDDVIMERFSIWANGLPLCGHNIIKFDWPIIQAYCKDWKPALIDTLVLAREHFDGLKYHNLKAMCEHLNIKLENAHSALGDVLATKDLYIYLLNRHKLMKSTRVELPQDTIPANETAAMLAELLFEQKKLEPKIKKAKERLIADLAIDGRLEYDRLKIQERFGSSAVVAFEEIKQEFGIKDLDKLTERAIIPTDITPDEIEDLMMMMGGKWYEDEIFKEWIPPVGLKITLDWKDFLSAKKGDQDKVLSWLMLRGWLTLDGATVRKRWASLSEVPDELKKRLAPCYEVASYAFYAKGE